MKSPAKKTNAPAVAVACALALTASLLAAWAIVRLPGASGADVQPVAVEPTATPMPTPTPAPTPSPTPMPENWHAVDTAASDAVTLAFTGDVNFADDWYIMQHYRGTGSTDFADAFSAELLEQMRSADILLCNNEFSISDRGTPLPGKAYTFRAAPANAAYWQVMGADVVSLANNHCGDYGPDAFTDTLDILKSTGIATIGAGRNLAEAQQAQYYVANGITIAYVGATRAEKFIMTPQATQDSPGVLYTYDPAETLEAIKQAAQQADFVVVYVHWGTEESTVLEQAQIDLATQYAEAGADLIVGAHPHILQGAGWRGSVPVFYSLGNFWFNMESQDTALLTVTLRAPDDITCTVLPCRQANGFTSLLTEDADRQRVWQNLNNIMENGHLDETGVFCPEEAAQ